MLTTAVGRRGVRFHLGRPARVRCTRRHPIPRRTGGTFLIGLVLAVAPVVAIAPRSGASSIGGLEAKAQRIADQITADNARLAALGAQYLAEHSAYVGATADEARIRTQIVSDDRLVDHDVAAVRSAAVAAYVGAGSNGPIGLSWAKAPDVAVSSATYLSVASNHLDELAAALVSDRRHLVALLGARQRAAAAASVALTATAMARSTVLTTVAGEAHLYHSTNSELNALVAAKAAAEAAAALARQEAAAAAAARAAAATTTSTASDATVPTSASSAPAVTAGPPSPAALSTPAPSAPQSVAADFAAIRNCESSDVYTLNTGNGYYGAYQFSAATWESLGGAGLASSASPAAQDAAAYLLYQRDGDSFSAWGTCAAIDGIT